MMDFPWDFMEISYGFNGKWCLSDVKIGDVMEHHDDIIGYIYIPDNVMFLGLS